MQEFKTLKLIQQTTSTKEKVATLKLNETENLKAILNYTYNPYLTYRVQQLDFPEKYNYVQPDIYPELSHLLDTLARHTTTPSDARAAIKTIMSRCTEEGASWVAKIVRKDLKIGCGVSLINQAFPDLVPEFSVQLAKPIIEPKSGYSHWDRVVYPCCLEKKADGMFIASICDGETVKFMSREGIEQDALDHLAAQILVMRPGTKFVLIGESIGIKYNPNCKTAKKNYEAGKNWQFAQGLSMTKSSKGTYPEKEMRECLGYLVWDILDYDFFMTQGKIGLNLPLSKRKMELAAFFARLGEELPSVKMMENVVVHSKEEIIEHFNREIAAGGEGIILKDPNALYEFKRSYAVIKMKGFYTADLRVLDCYEGTAGTKNEGTLGTILVGDGTVSGRLMGGWDDDLGYDIWCRHKRGEMVGTIVECLYMERTVDNSLRHGLFIRERPDKTECSWG